MRFSKSASAFTGLEPVYIRSVFSGLRDALRNGQRISWGPTLDVAAWVVDQPLGRLQPDWVREDRDPGWDWTWAEIGRLLDEGLTDRPNRIPRSMTGQVRALALRLTDHPDPTPESEAQYGGSNMDPHMLSINTTRGTAAHTLIRLAWWEKQVLGRKRLEAHVKAALQRLATPGEEPSLAVHSVFGMWFGTLSWLDPEWATSLVDRIFPSAAELESFWWAAWGITSFRK